MRGAGTRRSFVAGRPHEPLDLRGPEAEGDRPGDAVRIGEPYARVAVDVPGHRIEREVADVRLRADAEDEELRRTGELAARQGAGRHEHDAAHLGRVVGCG